VLKKYWILDARSSMSSRFGTGIYAVAGTIVDVGYWILDDEDQSPLKKEPVPQLREG
jgi:hypothetical protein